MAVLAKDYLLSETQLVEAYFFSSDRVRDERLQILGSFEQLRSRGLPLLKKWFSDLRFERLLSGSEDDTSDNDIDDKELRRLKGRERRLDASEQLLNGIIKVNQACRGKLQPLANPLNPFWRRRRYGKFGLPSPEEDRKVIGENNQKRENAVRKCLAEIRAWLRVT